MRFPTPHNFMHSKSRNVQLPGCIPHHMQWRSSQMSAMVEHEVIELLSSSDDEQTAQCYARRKNATRASRPKGPLRATERIIQDDFLTTSPRRRIRKPLKSQAASKKMVGNTEDAQRRCPPAYLLTSTTSLTLLAACCPLYINSYELFCSLLDQPPACGSRGLRPFPLPSRSTSIAVLTSRDVVQWLEH